MPNPPEMQIAEYDNIIVGSSPLNLIVALQKLSNNEKVLLIEENEKLKGIPNVIITPHVGSRTFQSVVRQGTMAVENLLKSIN